MTTPALGDRRGSSYQIVRAMRPRQWIKNLLVFAAPMTAGSLSRGPVLGRTAIAAGLFVAASAGVYLLNDVIDAESDRIHPLKRHRPVASGSLDPRTATAAAIVLFSISLVGAVLLAGSSLAYVFIAYCSISIGYSLGLKHVPIVELGCVASGFVLRTVAGGAAVHEPISKWFLLVASSGSFLIVVGKRTAEQLLLKHESAAHRPTLDAYPAAFLRSARTVAVTVSVVGYCLWAFERATSTGIGRIDRSPLLTELSIIPFVFAILTIELDIENGNGGEPEELAMRNRPLQCFGLLCLLLVVLGIYA